MSRQQFLGNIDRSIKASLLTNYNVPTKIPDGIKLHEIKRQDDFVLIELGTLLTPNECNEIITNIHGEAFENMPGKYDITKRNNSRLIVRDDRLARTLWRRLKFSNKLTKLIPNPQPLGFNVQGQWEMNGVNGTMRLNRYNEGEYFSAHKDSQYAPNGDKRSFLSLIIYLTDNYEKGETKFYFPKNPPKFDVKGLTIKEEIKSYGGLEKGFECVTIKPKQGYAILFTHNLLHEAVAPELMNQIATTQRYVLRTDVLVERKEKFLGFAVSSKEKEDYFACLNFFREAQQNELREYQGLKKLTGTTNTGDLYERSLSIRYCYPRLLNSSIKEETFNSIFKKFPSEIWLHIFQFLHEQDVENFIFAYPYLISLKMTWDTQERKSFKTNSLRSKFIPSVERQYGTETRFCFSDEKFFDENLHACCRVAAVYAFFLLGHAEDSDTYIVRYNRDTHEVCKVEMEKLLSDVFYNRNCYGSLYKVKQKDESTQNPMIDLDHSVDRTYMTNRHQSQFIGQDLLSRFRFKIKKWDTSNDEVDSDKYDQYVNERDLLARQRKTALTCNSFQIVNECADVYERDHDDVKMVRRKDHVLGYRTNLIRQTEQDSGASLCRILSAKNLSVLGPCEMHSGDCSGTEKIQDLVQIYNHLIFDFDTHQLSVENISEDMDDHSSPSNRNKKVCSSITKENRTEYYRVNVEKLAKETKGFNHASCESYYPDMIVDQFSFLDYTYLSYVHLAVTRSTENIGHVYVKATYGGIAAL